MAIADMAVFTMLRWVLGPGHACTCLDQERNRYEDGEDEHAAQSIQMQCAATGAIHQRNGDQSHYNLRNIVTYNMIEYSE